AGEPGMRLVWCVRSMPGSASYPELITMTAVEDGEALERLGTRTRSGDLRDLSSELGRHRAGLTTRVLASLEEFNPYMVQLDNVTPGSEVWRQKVHSLAGRVRQRMIPGNGGTTRECIADTEDHTANKTLIRVNVMRVC